MQVVGADFVPIHPYTTTSVLVGIGESDRSPEIADESL